MPGNDLRRDIYLENPTELEKNDIRRQIREIEADIKGGRYNEDLRKSGIDPKDINALGSDFLKIEMGQEATGVELLLIGILAREGAKVSAKIFGDIWTRIVLPRIEARYGTRVHRTKPPEK
jgi:hypothetical protein